MLSGILNKLRQATDRTGFIRDDDLPIMEALFKEGKQKQYGLEKILRESGKSVAHSTVAGKLQRLFRYGLVNSTKENNGFTYYELTPLGLSCLVYRQKISFDKAITYLENNQKQYFEYLAKIQPNLIEQLEKQPPWFVTQLTEDLWVIYHIIKRSDLRKQTIKFVLALSRGDEAKPELLDFKLQPLCVHRIEVEGKGMCSKLRKECVYKPREVAKCKILNEQMLKELAKSAEC
jgi:predicted transcriptional regulator